MESSEPALDLLILASLSLQRRWPPLILVQRRYRVASIFREQRRTQCHSRLIHRQELTVVARLSRSCASSGTSMDAESVLMAFKTKNAAGGRSTSFLPTQPPGRGTGARRPASCTAALAGHDGSHRDRPPTRWWRHADLRLGRMRSGWTRTRRSGRFDLQPAGLSASRSSAGDQSAPGRPRGNKDVDHGRTSSRKGARAGAGLPRTRMLER